MFGDRHVFVRFIVIEETPYLSGLLATVTVMTLMTLIHGLMSVVLAMYVLVRRWL